MVETATGQVESGLMERYIVGSDCLEEWFWTSIYSQIIMNKSK